MMAGPALRAGSWPAVAGVTSVAALAGGCGAAIPAAATVLFPICFTLLAAASAFTLDEPASLIVDVTPTGPVPRTSIRAVGLLAPLAAGALVMMAAELRGLALPWTATSLALAGNVLLGFTAACVARTRTGEPGPAAAAVVVLGLMTPILVPQVGRWIRTFPPPGAGGPSSDPVWWTVVAVCVVAIAISVGSRSLPGAVQSGRTARMAIQRVVPGQALGRVLAPGRDRASRTSKSGCAHGRIPAHRGSGSRCRRLE